LVPKPSTPPTLIITLSAIDPATLKSTGDAAKTVTNVGTIATGTVAAGSLAVSAITATSAISSSLLPIYSLTARPLLAFPFDLAQGMFAGLTESFAGLFAPIFGFRKRKSKRGVVFDGLSGMPLAGAYIIMFSESGNLKTCFTDQKGQYSVKLRPDNYSLKAEKFNYIFPSKLITVSMNAAFGHIYRPGEKIEIGSTGESIADIAVPMDPNTGVSALNKMFVKITDNFSLLTKKLSVPLAILSLVVSGIAAYSDAGYLYTIIFLAITVLYMFQLIGALRRKLEPSI
jgi:hypothetical protein